MTPLSPDRFALQLMISEATREKRTVPNQVRREAVARDGLRCSFVSEDGRRCEETGFLELDHVVPVALGGEASDGVRVLCRSHNQYEAERILGRTAVEAGKAAKAMDGDLVAGLRRMGVTASDARQAVAASRGPGEVEERMRAALGALRTMYEHRGTRCREPYAEYRCGPYRGSDPTVVRVEPLPDVHSAAVSVVRVDGQAGRDDPRVVTGRARGEHGYEQVLVARVVARTDLKIGLACWSRGAQRRFQPGPFLTVSREAYGLVERWPLGAEPDRVTLNQNRNF